MLLKRPSLRTPARARSHVPILFCRLTIVEEETDKRKSYIARLVHVGEQPRDGHVANGLLEEYLLYGGGADGAQRGQQQQQLPEAAGLSGVPASQHGINMLILSTCFMFQKGIYIYIYIRPGCNYLYYRISQRRSRGPAPS